MQPPDFADVQVGFVRVACRHWEEVESTNAEAMGLLRSAAPGSWHACTAAHQTAGRGRLGRIWTDQPGTDVLLSIAHRWKRGPGPERLAELNLMIAVAVRNALAALLPPHNADGLRLKWPNDILVGERKLAGLLLETSWRGTEWGGWVLGIGLNGGTRGDSGPAGWRDAGGGEEREELTRVVLRAVVEAVEAREQSGWEGPLAAAAAFNAVAFGCGERRRFEVQGTVYWGMFLQVEPDGRGRFAWEADALGRTPPDRMESGEVVWRLS
jgi:biotin-[acetyl-CoA-carboxylase] ligase BirA-like protein